MSVEDYGDRIILTHFTIGWAAPEMYVFHLSEQRIEPLDYEKDSSEMAPESKRLMVYDDAGGMLLAFPGINYMSFSQEPLRWKRAVL